VDAGEVLQPEMTRHYDAQNCSLMGNAGELSSRSMTWLVKSSATADKL